MSEQMEERPKQFWAKAVSGEMANLTMMRRNVQNMLTNADQYLALAKPVGAPEPPIEPYSMAVGERGALGTVIEMIDYLISRQRTAETELMKG